MGCWAEDDPKIAEKLKALAHPARLTILRALAAREKSCCGDLVEDLDLAQSTVSQHLKILAQAGLIENSARGLKAAYRVRGEAIDELKAQMGDLFECLCFACRAPAATVVEAEQRSPA